MLILHLKLQLLSKFEATLSKISEFSILGIGQNRKLKNSKTLEIFTFLNKNKSWPLSFCFGNFFVVFASKLQLLSKFENNVRKFQGFDFRYWANFVFSKCSFSCSSYRVFYFIGKSCSALETCTFISQYLMKIEIYNVMKSISTERGSFYIYVYLIINH